jgi:hypothetical protein
VEALLAITIEALATTGILYDFCQVIDLWVKWPLLPRGVSAELHMRNAELVYRAVARVV